MSSNPTKLPLSELLELIIDHRGKTPNKMGFDDFSLSGVPVLSAKHVKTDGLVEVQSMRYASTEMYKKWMTVEVQEGDIILTSEAPMGEVFYIQDDKKYVLGQRVFGLRPNPRLINQKYLAAWLASSEGQRQIAARASGSTVQGIRQAELLKLEIDLPSREEQERIANVRFSLTDKISLNRGINQTLEAMAQAKTRCAPPCAPSAARPTPKSTRCPASTTINSPPPPRCFPMKWKNQSWGRFRRGGE